MKRAEIARLLTMAAAFDRRTLGEADVAAWHSVLDDLDFPEAESALKAHYADTREFVMPSDIRRRAIASRRDRANRAENARIMAELHGPKPDADTYARGFALAASALRPPDHDDDAEKTARWAFVRSVPCPYCGADVGHPCVRSGTQSPLRMTAGHPSRVEAAEKANP